MIRLQSFNSVPLLYQAGMLVIAEIPTIVELSCDLLYSKLVRVNRENLFTGQFRVVLSREEEVLNGHVGPSELSVLNLDLKLLSIAIFPQTIAQ